MWVTLRTVHASRSSCLNWSTSAAGSPNKLPLRWVSGRWLRTIVCYCHSATWSKFDHQTKAQLYHCYVLHVGLSKINAPGMMIGIIFQAHTAVRKLLCCLHFWLSGMCSCCSKSQPGTLNAAGLARLQLPQPFLQLLNAVTPLYRWALHSLWNCTRSLHKVAKHLSDAATKQEKLIL